MELDGDVLRDWNLVKKGFDFFHRDWHQHPEKAIFIPEFLIVPEVEVHDEAEDCITEHHALSKVFSALQELQSIYQLGGIFVARFDVVKIIKKIRHLQKDLLSKKSLLENWRAWVTKRGREMKEDNILVMHPQLGIVLMAINPARYGSISFQDRYDTAKEAVQNVQPIFFDLIGILTASQQTDIQIKGMYCLPQTSELTFRQPNHICKENVTNIEQFAMFWKNRVEESINKHGRRNYYENAAFQKLVRFIVTYRSNVTVCGRNAHETYPHLGGAWSENEARQKSIFHFNPRQLSSFLSINRHQILFGLPGTGKTLLLELLATHANRERRPGKVLIVTGGVHIIKRYNKWLSGNKQLCLRQRHPEVRKKIDLRKVSDDDDFIIDEMQSLSRDWLDFLQKRSKLKDVYTTIAVSGRAWATDVEGIMASAIAMPELKEYLFLNLTIVIRGTKSIIRYWADKYLPAVPPIGHSDEGIDVDDRDVEGTTGGVLIQVKKHVLRFLNEDKIAHSDIAVITINKWAAEDIVQYLEDQKIPVCMAEKGGSTHIQVDYNNNVLSQEYPAVIFVNYYGYLGTSESTEFTALTRAITRLVVIRKDRMIIQREIDSIMQKPANQGKAAIKMANIVKEAAENLYKREKTAIEWKNSLNTPIKDWERAINVANDWDQSLAELRYNVLPDFCEKNDHFKACKVFSDVFQVLIENDQAMKDFLITHVLEDHPFYSYKMVVSRLEENDYESALGPDEADVQDETIRYTLLQFLNCYFKSLQYFLTHTSVEDRSKNFTCRKDISKWQPITRTLFTLGNSIQQKIKKKINDAANAVPSSGYKEEEKVESFQGEQNDHLQWHITPHRVSFLNSIQCEINDIRNMVFKTTVGVRRIQHMAQISTLSILALCGIKDATQLREEMDIHNIPEKESCRIEDQIERETERTPLHYAVCAEEVSLAFVHCLLEHGFDPLKQTSDSKRSALHLASASGNSALVKMLLSKVTEKRKAFKCRDQLERNPLHYVSQGPRNKESQKIVHLLMESNGDVPVAKDLHGATALHLAVVNNNRPVLKKLLSFKMFRDSINEQDISNKTALSFADDYPHLVQLLIENGAKVSKTGKTLKKKSFKKRAKNKTSETVQNDDEWLNCDSD